MEKNINCAEMGYDCVFSLTAEAEEQEFMLDTVEQHAATKHPELIKDLKLKPEVKEKLKSLLSQSHYTTD